MTPPADLRLFAHAACVWEATARKVGNVHPGASFADAHYLDFILSAGSLASVIGEAASMPLGETILAAVRARKRVCATNTNLGIILLLAPLAARTDLDRLDRDDARNVYAAIREASAGGLGNVEAADVAEEPTISLREAMALAAHRDLIARQYANGFRDIHEFGVPALLGAWEELPCVEWAILNCQLRWLAAFPDSLIARKNGPAVAADVQARAVDFWNLGGFATAAGRTAGRELDAHLRADGHARNPGTTADLVTACLFLALRDRRLSPNAPFAWNAPDWL